MPERINLLRLAASVTASITVESCVPNNLPVDQGTPSAACRQIDIMPGYSRSLDQYLVFNGLPDGEVQIIDGKTRKEYDLPKVEAGKDPRLPGGINADVLFGEENRVTFRMGCLDEKTNL